MLGRHRLLRTACLAVASLVGLASCEGSTEPTLRIAQVEVLAERQVLDVNESTMLVPRALTAGGRLVPGATFSWEGLDPAVVSVDGSGRVTGLAHGEGKVRVTVTGPAVALDEPVSATVLFRVFAIVLRAAVPPKVVDSR